MPYAQSQACVPARPQTNRCAESPALAGQSTGGTNRGGSMANAVKLGGGKLRLGPLLSVGAGRRPAHSPPRRDFPVSDRLSPKMPHGRAFAIATLLAAALAPTPAHARAPAPKLTGLRCVPATRAACHP